MPEAEPELSTDGVKAFSGAGARPNGKAVQGGGDDTMQLDATNNAPKNALQWKLRFERFGGKQPDFTKKGDDGGEDAPNFKAFGGGGQTLKAARGS